MRPLVIVGSGGHGRVVLDTASAAGITVRAFIDCRKHTGVLVNNVPVLGGNELLEDQAFLSKNIFLVAVGNQQARRDISIGIIRGGGELATIVHPSCIVSPFATIGRGTVLVAGCIVNANAHIGRYCILNTGCSVDHDTQVADGVQISPGARLAGSVVCGEGVFIGTGAIVIPKVRIGRYAIVGAGAVVIRNVPESATVMGSPAAQRP